MKIAIRNWKRKSAAAGFCLLALMLFHLTASATHLRAGNITVSRQSCTSNVYTITITAYTNDKSTVKFSQSRAGTLNFGDGSAVHHPDTQLGMQVPGFGTEFFYVVYSVQHTYTSGRYTISYLEPNRNGGILNMDNSIQTPFYIETVISIDPFSSVCESSPVFSVPPLDKACVGVRWEHNPGAYDLDFDSLSYELVTPKQSRAAVVNGFRAPNDRSFYASNYNTANQDHNGPPIFNIDHKGTVTWDSPGAAGEYNIAFHVIEWRQQNDGTYLQVGYVRRDMQIIVQDCNNLPPMLTLNSDDVCVEAGKTVSQDIVASDPEGSAVKIEAFTILSTFNPNPDSVSPDPAIFQATSPGVPAVLHFKWATLCKDVVRQPYQVVFKATDKPANPEQQLIDFSVMDITVVGPAPIWKATAVTALSNHRAILSWQDYTCANSAVIMQVWRRVDSLPFTPSECQVGMPPSLGFVKIAEVPIHTITYTDTNNGAGLAAGAQYCYRLVAAWPTPAGGLSYVSEERCFTTLQDAPIITNVSINPTDPAGGEDTVRWLAPRKADIDTILFPPPYQYEIYRAEGLTGGDLVQIVPGKTSNTFIVDNDIDTQNKTFHYQIVAYSSIDSLIDRSAPASTVRLELHPGLTNIELNWSAEVPWSNQTPKKHIIYRGPAGSTLVSQLQIIDSVDVLQNRLHYVDSGKFNSTPLDKATIYCYCVRTAGSYGNVNIPQTLYNYSQISCAQPNDTTPPCKITINAKGTDCSTLYAGVCNLSSYSNTLTWKTPSLDCIQEAYRYNIYVASQTGGDYVYKASVTDTFYIDANLTSFARCYRVSAVSRSLIEGPLSDPFCFDNCPHYEFPNVFTPGNPDNCNDLFSAYGNRAESLTDPCQPQSDADIKARCARFVNSVNFTVLNRWGKEVYNYSSDGENTIYVDWDGRDNQGKEVTSGIYYFVAEVEFNVVDPKKRNQKIKGWVQVIR